jgi:molybdopterin-guanine dinucleotide biosynthesis protein B
MTPAKAVAVVGYKDSGKTRVVEALVKELTSRGHQVGTLKHTAEDTPLDTPGKDTHRHREAGSKASAIIHETGAALFVDGYMTVNEAIAKLGTLDYVVIEGFKTLTTVARVIVPKEPGHVEELSNGLEIAVADLIGGGLPEAGTPIIPLDRIDELADAVERRAYPILAGLNCHGCGYEDCHELGKAILREEAEAENCVAYTSEFGLKVNDVDIPLGPFVQDVTRNVLLGLVKSYKGVSDPRKIEIRFEAKRDG